MICAAIPTKLTFFTGVYKSPLVSAQGGVISTTAELVVPATQCGSFVPSSHGFIERLLMCTYLQEIVENEDTHVIRIVLGARPQR